MDALAAGVDQGGNRKLQLTNQSVLLLQLHVVRLHQGEAEVGDVGILDAVAVQGIKADPRAHGGIIVAQDGADIAAAALQRLDQISGGPVPAAPGRHILAVVLEALGDVAHVVGGIEEGFQVPDQILNRVPILRLLQLAAFHPARVPDDDASFPASDFGIPVQLLALAGPGLPAPVLGHLHYRSAGDRSAASVTESRPFAGAFSRVVP